MGPVSHMNKYKRPIAQCEDLPVDIPPSPLLERVKTKLTAWSWEMEKAQDADEQSAARFHPRALPFIQARSRSPSEGLEVPSPPPNTERHSGQSSCRHSTQRTSAAEEELTVAERDALRALGSGTPEMEDTDLEDEEEEDEADLLIPQLKPKVDSLYQETNTKPGVSALDRPSMWPPRTSCPALPAETHFQSHRNSVELARDRRHTQEMAGKLNQSLMNVRDSFVITKSKLSGRYPVTSPSSSSNLHRLKQHPPLQSPGLSLRSQNLSPFLAMNSSAAANPVEPPRPLPPTLQEHGDCPICEVDRPEWIRARRMDTEK
jgi:hypothetical protein